MKISPLTKETISTAQAKSISGRGSPVNETAVVCSIIRSVLWLDSKTKHPIHTTRIINQAIKFSVHSRPESDQREEIKLCLEKLERSGDLVSFSKGKWLPASLKEIIIDADSGESLFLGGAPSRVFPKSIRNEINHHKQYRKIRSGSLDEVSELPKFDLEFWARIPEGDLESWAKKIKNIPLEEVSDNAESGRNFEVYLPHAHKTIQKFRWKRQFNEASGKCICRCETVTGTYYYIGELRNGEIVSLSQSLTPSDSARLMYAEDFAHDRSVTANIEIANGELTVEISNLMPINEYMIFDALGDSAFESGGPMMWRFDVKYRNVIINLLQRLKIKIEG